MSKWRPTIVTLLVIVSSGLIKAHVHFIRLALICIFGLMGMFLLHQLAQDWNKIRNGNKPANRPGGGGMGGGGMRPPRLISVLGAAGKLLHIVKRSAEPNQVPITTFGNLMNKFTSVLFFDPIGCARKFLCYAGTKSKNNMTEKETNLLKLFEFHENETNAFKTFKKAVDLGRITKNTIICENTYKTCYLSNEQLYTFYKYL